MERSRILPALTLHQPWAHLVAHAARWPAGLGKTVENRSWQTNYRGPLAIHASKSWKPAYVQSTLARLRNLGLVGGSCPEVDMDRLRQECGHVVGRGELVGIERSSASPWYVAGNWAWELRSLEPVIPVAVAGAQGLWTLPGWVELRPVPQWQIEIEPSAGRVRLPCADARSALRVVSALYQAGWRSQHEVRLDGRPVVLFDLLLLLLEQLGDRSGAAALRRDRSRYVEVCPNDAPDEHRCAATPRPSHRCDPHGPPPPTESLGEILELAKAGRLRARCGRA